MSSRPCSGGCGTQVSGRRRRCPDCRLKFRAKQERERYHSGRGQDITDYEHLDDYGEVVDYTTSTAKPPTPDDPTRPYRQHWTHDNVTRIRRLHEMNSADDDEPEITSWEELNARHRQRPNMVEFPAPPGTASNPFFAHRGPAGPPDNPAAAGVAFTPRVLSDEGRRGYLVDRWNRPR